MPLSILFRHGHRYLNTGEISGDGPLTKEGLETVRIQAHQLAAELKRKDAGSIDCAIVSGSARCAQTFTEIWRILLKKKIIVHTFDMHAKYTASANEAKEWNALYAQHGVMLRAEIDRIGEKAAVMQHAGNLVKPCAYRTIDGIKQAMKHGAETTLVVTHAPHDTDIAEAFTGNVYPECLKLGHYRIIEWE